jgi:hypothetical protein
LKEQTTLASLAWAGTKKQTKRDKFHGEMERVVPWEALRVKAPAFKPLMLDQCQLIPLASTSL